MINIPIGAQVKCTDGPAGRTTHVIINPVTRKVTHFVVKENALLMGKERLVPIEQVLDTTHDEIQLDCSRDELAKMELFFGTRYIQQEPKEYPSSFYAGEGPQYMHAFSLATDPIPVKVERIPPGELGVHRGTTVEATDGRVGWVDEFLVDPDSGEITHLVVRTAPAKDKKMLTLPVSAIDLADQDKDAVYLKLDKQAVEALPTIPVSQTYAWEKAKTELVAIIFKDEDKAREVLNYLRQFKRDEVIGAIRSAAVLVNPGDEQAVPEGAEKLGGSALITLVESDQVEAVAAMVHQFEGQVLRQADAMTTGSGQKS